MTRECTQKMLPLMQAYAEGKEIQIKDIHGQWQDCGEPSFSELESYRIKPAETYRPYKDINELCEAWKQLTGRTAIKNTMPLIWVKPKRDLRNTDSVAIIGFCQENDFDNSVLIDSTWLSFQELFDNFTFLDGTLCGVKQ